MTILRVVPILRVQSGVYSPGSSCKEAQYGAALAALFLLRVAGSATAVGWAEFARAAYICLPDLTTPTFATLLVTTALPLALGSWDLLELYVRYVAGGKNGEIWYKWPSACCVMMPS